MTTVGHLLNGSMQGLSGNNFENDLKSLKANRLFIAYDKKADSWSVIHLNLFQRILRNGFGRYASTHINTLKDRLTVERAHLKNSRIFDSNWNALITKVNNAVYDKTPLNPPVLLQSLEHDPLPSPAGPSRFSQFLTGTLGLAKSSLNQLCQKVSNPFKVCQRASVAIPRNASANPQPRLATATQAFQVAQHVVGQSVSQLTSLCRWSLLSAANYFSQPVAAPVLQAVQQPVAQPPALNSPAVFAPAANRPVASPRSSPSPEAPVRKGQGLMELSLEALERVGDADAPFYIKQAKENGATQEQLLAARTVYRDQIEIKNKALLLLEKASERGMIIHYTKIALDHGASQDEVRKAREAYKSAPKPSGSSASAAISATSNQKETALRKIRFAQLQKNIIDHWTGIAIANGATTQEIQIAKEISGHYWVLQCSSDCARNANSLKSLFILNAPINEIIHFSNSGFANYRETYLLKVILLGRLKNISSDKEFKTYIEALRGLGVDESEILQHSHKNPNVQVWGIKRSNPTPPGGASENEERKE